MKLRLFCFVLFSAMIFNARAQLKIGDQPTVQEKSVALDVKGSNGMQGLWLPRVSDTTNAGIDGLNPPNGLLIYHIPSQNLMVRLNGVWVPIIKYDTSINKIFVNGTTPVTGTDIVLRSGNSAGSNNDFNLQAIPGTKEIIINLPDASNNVRGAVNGLAQTFGGLKTFANGAAVQSGMQVAGSTANSSMLTLGLTSATTPGTAADRFLTVNNAGLVTLNSLAAITSVTAGGAAMTGPALTYNTSTTGNDFSISSVGNTATWNLPDASATARGAITFLSQTFAGLKTFNTGAVVNSGLSVTGFSGSTSNLTLGLTSATTAAAQTTKYLSVDATGRVTLNALNAITSVSAGGNTLTGPALTYATANSGADFSITTTGNTATWNLPDASATSRGAVNSLAQTFGGLKTFATGATVAGATGATSNLNLGINAATTAAAQTNKYLSVDATGRVTLNALNSINSVTAGGNLMIGPDLLYNTSATGTDFSITSTGNTATWNLPDASATSRGAVNGLAQSFAGLKTFATGATINGATGAASNLTLGITSATTAAEQTNKYLSVDAGGRVTLNTLNTLTSVNAGGNVLTGPVLTYNTANSGTDFSITTLGNTATWNLPDASATNRGAVTSLAQTFGGLKTFGNGVVVNNGSMLNGGSTANGGLVVSGNTANASNLTLGITSATAAGTQTNKYLTVDGTGRVTLNSLNVISSVTAGASTMTGPAITYVASNSGDDFTITSSGNTASWNLPDAGTTSRGLVNTAAQTFGGLKTLNNGAVVNNGLTVTGATTSTSNLSLGLTSATVPATNTDKYLSVNAAGNVTLNSVSVTSNLPIKIRGYHMEINEAPVWVRVGTPQYFTFTVPGAAFNINSTVTVSPVKQLNAGTKINWARIRNATTIEVAISAEGSDQKLNPGLGNEADFYITVLEF